MAFLNVIELILAVTIIGLAAIILAAEASLLVQSASAITDVVAEIVGEEEASNTTDTYTTISRNNSNNNSNPVLGSLFVTGQDRLLSFSRINETYSEGQNILVTED